MGSRKGRRRVDKRKDGLPESGKLTNACGHDKINARHLFYLHMARAIRVRGTLPP
ncbi:hypothetical protein ANACOL_01282 [Anaerotruncus colihominis DSM 17241]|uniref:Uncharacterized protein n=1 Tax=Anaerotruncus colihominis DSM 17241 TaxID=445972 RepID=B0P936_9FIRM|nr:hypothetical protein ANACOL_01282 [Anaerotruncus colihominis DSM 17241]